MRKEPEKTYNHKISEEGFRYEAITKINLQGSQERKGRDASEVKTRFKDIIEHTERKERRS